MRYQATFMAKLSRILLLSMAFCFLSLPAGARQMLISLDVVSPPEAVDDQALDSYVMQLRKNIEGKWDQKNDGALLAKVFFQILSNGAFLQVGIQNSSNDQNFDKAAVKAVEASFPYDPLPHKKLKVLNMVATFNGRSGEDDKAEVPPSTEKTVEANPLPMSNMPAESSSSQSEHNVSNNSLSRSWNPDTSSYDFSWFRLKTSKEISKMSAADEKTYLENREAWFQLTPEQRFGPIP